MAAPAFADVALPNNNKSHKEKNPTATVFMDIRENEYQKQPTLMISRSLLQKLRAGLDDNGGASQNAANVSRFDGFGGKQTMMAGLFLSLALTFGGVWIVRTHKQSKGVGGRRLSQAALGLMICALCGASASLAYANAGVPPPRHPLNSGILIEDVRGSGIYDRVKVEVIDGPFDGVVLDLPKK
jgi:hypothetical protein